MRVALLVASTLLLAGCASSDPESFSGSTNVPISSDLLVPPPTTVEVVMMGTQFLNQSITIYMGDTVRWVHHDGMTPHNVESQDPAFDSNPNCRVTGVPLAQVCMVEGSMFERTFTKAQTVEYHCEIHAGMTGTLKVLGHGGHGEHGA